MNGKRVDKDTYLTLDTAIVRPVFSDLRLQAEVITLSGTKTIYAADCFTLVKNTFEFCGKSIGYAIKEANELLGPYHKIPIVVENVAGQLFVLVPLLSPRSPLNTWVALHAIALHKKSAVANGFTDIYLTNGEIVTVNSSFTTLNRQIVLANALRAAYLKNVEDRHQFLSFASPLLPK